MNFPRISIVVPSFNQGQYLEETLLSVINQQYPNLELFVVDGGSTDNSVEIIKKHEQQITWWVSEKDNGQSDAINKGFKRVTGDIVNWICSDDKLAPGALAIIAELFNSSTEETGVVYGNIEYINSYSEIIKNPFDNVKNRVRKRIDFFKGMAFAQPAGFFKRSLLEKVGYLNTTLHFGMDYELFAKFAMLSHFKHTKKLIAFYRLHTDSKTLKHTKDFNYDWLQVCGRIFATLFQTKFKELIDELRQEGLDYIPDYPVYNFSFNREKINDVTEEEIRNEFLCLMLEYQLAFKKYTDAYILLKYLKKVMPDLLNSEIRLNKHFNRFKWLGAWSYGKLMKIIRR